MYIHVCIHTCMYIYKLRKCCNYMYIQVHVCFDYMFVCVFVHV